MVFLDPRANAIAITPVLPAIAATDRSDLIALLLRLHTDALEVSPAAHIGGQVTILPLRTSNPPDTTADHPLLAAPLVIERHSGGATFAVI
jgi:hypothetical protein